MGSPDFGRKRPIGTFLYPAENQVYVGIVAEQSKHALARFGARQAKPPTGKTILISSIVALSSLQTPFSTSGPSVKGSRADEHSVGSVKMASPCGKSSLRWIQPNLMNFVDARFHSVSIDHLPNSAESVIY